MIGCLFRLALLLLLIAIYYLLLSLRSPFPTMVFSAEGVEVAAGLAGFFMWFAVLSLLDVRRYISDRNLINKRPLRDGEKIVVSGSIKASGPLLTAPFSGKQCVGYHYNVTRTVTIGNNPATTWVYYEGYALIRSVISGPLGDLRILAESDKELFYEVPSVTPAGAFERAKKYFETIESTKETGGLGHFRVDKIIDIPKDLEKCDMQESLVLNGETVLANGIYSAKHNGICPDPDGIMRPFHLVPGGDISLKKKTRSRLISATVCSVLSSAVVAIYYIIFVPRFG